MCGFVWSTREDFLSDPDVALIGYQVNFSHLLAGFFLFAHSCATSLAVRAAEFADLYDGPIFEKPLTGSDSCPGYCLRKDELDSCSARCECAYVREILQIIKDWPRHTTRDASPNTAHKGVGGGGRSPRVLL
jgi:hypothetical protein